MARRKRALAPPPVDGREDFEQFRDRWNARITALHPAAPDAAIQRLVGHVITCHVSRCPEDPVSRYALGTGRVDPATVEEHRRAVAR